MEEYKNIVISALPMMLNPETKGKASVTIASYMNAMLRNVKTVEDLRVFNQALQQCKDFSSQNNLGGLNRTCAEWDREGIIKLESLSGTVTKQNISNPQVVAQIQQYLNQTKNNIHPIGRVDIDQLEEVKASLNQIEEFIISNGNQCLTQEQIQQFLNEIIEQKEQLKKTSMLIDDIIDSAGINR